MTVVITEFKSRTNTYGIESTYKWEDLKKKLATPVVTSESLDEYQSMTNEERTNIKDVGGFIGGALVNSKRGRGNLKNRTLLVVDADEGKGTDIQDFLAMYPEVMFCCHTTHTSTPDNLRLRWVFPLAREITPDEYRLLSHIIMHWVGADSIDDSTDQPARLMFWPSCCLDGSFSFWDGGTMPIDPDTLLGELSEEDRLLLQVSNQKNIKDNLASGSLLINEGYRNKAVFTFASSLRAQGLDYAGIRSMVEDYNDRYVNPPLEPFELDTICRSSCKFEAGEPVHASLRDAYYDFKDMGTWKDTPSETIDIIKAESLASLGARDVVPPNFAVPGLIPVGLTILAAPPKFGKSWLALDLAISVATGTDFLSLPVNQSGVIYMALEDGDFRLKERGIKVAGSRPLPGNLLLVEQAPMLKDDLLPKLSALMNNCGTNIGLIIVDTLQKIRGVAGKTEGVYGHDYRELGTIQRFALDNNLAVIVIHHMNKGTNDGDIFNSINGSSGLTGACDCMLAMRRRKRNDDYTQFAISGRDVNERTLAIHMDWNLWRWQNMGELEEVEDNEEDAAFFNDPIVKTIQYKLDQADDMSDEEVSTVEWTCTSGELLDEISRLFGSTEYTGATAVGMKVKKLLYKLDKELGIGYEYRRDSNQRYHAFTREKV